MSWLKDLSSLGNDTKDPFLKWLFRLTFLLIFIVLVFFAYAIFTGKSVQIANWLFGVKKDTAYIPKQYTTGKIPEPKVTYLEDSDKINLDEKIDLLISNIPRSKIDIFIEVNINDEYAIYTAHSLKDYLETKGFDDVYTYNSNSIFEPGFVLQFVPLNYNPGGGFGARKYDTINILIGSLIETKAVKIEKLN